MSKHQHNLTNCVHSAKMEATAPLEAAEVPPANKKRRPRKKQLFNTILAQMEFYFSDANLSKDRFLSQLLQEKNHVPLETFLQFNKIRKLTGSVEDIQKAVKKSELIELTEDRLAVFRKEPIKEKLNVDECTIYVEGLKSDATHTWLSSVFSELGKVVYVSIPKYKLNGNIKGFAFVEFDSELEAENTLKFFENIGCKIPADIAPEELCSITTFEGPENPDKEKTGQKRKIEEAENETENACKRVKIEEEIDEEKNKKKLKKELKKKNLIKELGLRVLSKKEWKKMRNKYLDLQKKKMHEFKKHLHKIRFGQTNYEKSNLKPPVTPVTEGCSEITEGVIVKIELPGGPPSDVKKLKNDIKSLNSDVKFVDIPNPGSEIIFVRFATAKNASDFCKLESFGKKSLLTGDEEMSYWSKIQLERDTKEQKTKKKQRGRDKLLKKAKHFKFDE